MTDALDLHCGSLGELHNSAFLFRFWSLLVLKSTKELPSLCLHFPAFGPKFSKSQPNTHGINLPFSAIATGTEERH